MARLVWPAYSWELLHGADPQRLLAILIYFQECTPPRPKTQPHNKIVQGQDEDEHEAGFEGVDIDPARQDQHERNIVAAMKALRAGELSRAVRALKSSGMADLSLPENVAKLKAPFIEPSLDAPAVEEPVVDPGAIPAVRVAQIVALIAKQDRLKAADDGGVSYATLQALTQTKKHRGILADNDRINAADFITAVIRDISIGTFATVEGAAALNAMKGVALDGGSKPRPILIARTLLQLAGKSIFRCDSVQQAIAAAVGPSQLGVGVSGGVEAAAHTAMAYLRLNPTHVALDTDASAAFNYLYKQAVLEVCAEFPESAGYIKTRYYYQATATFRGGGLSEPLKLDRKQGADQGCIFGSLIYSRAVKAIHEATLLAHPTVTGLSIIDGFTLLGPVLDVLAAYVTYKQLLLEKAGPHLNDTKRSAFGLDVSAEDKDRLSAAGVPLGDGFVLGGGPVGTQTFRVAHARATVSECHAVCAAVRDFIVTAKADAKRLLQRLDRLVRLCLPSTAVHLARAIEPDLARTALADLDLDIANTYMLILQVAPADFTTTSGATLRKCLEAPMRYGGVGIMSVASLCDEAYVGSLALVANVALTHGFLVDLVPDRDTAIAFPALAPALARLKLTLPPQEQQEQLLEPDRAAKTEAVLHALCDKPSIIWDISMKRMQHTFSVYRKHHQYKDLVNELPDEESKRIHLSQSSTGSSAWLSGHALTMPDQQFVNAVRRRLHLPVISAAVPVAKLCKKCKKYHPTLQIVLPNGHHVFWCAGIHQVMVNTLHADIKKELIMYLGKHLPDNLEVKPGEPILAGHWERKGAAPAPSLPGQTPVLTAGERGDIGIGRQNIEKPTVVIDVTTISPLSKSVALNQRLVQGAAAKVAYKKKVKVYDDKWHGIAPHLVPFAVELGGFIHPDSWRRLTTLVRPKFIEVVDGRPTINPEFHRQNRYLREKIQFLVQMSLSKFTASLDGFARNKMGPVPQGGAPPAAGGGNLGQQLQHDPPPDLG